MPLQLSDFDLSEDPARPARTALALKFVSLWNNAVAYMMEADKLTKGRDTLDPSLKAEIERLFMQFIDNGTKANELADWLFLDRRPLPQKEAWERANIGRNLADPWETFKRLQKKRVGAPNKYGMYLDVFDLMLKGSSVSLGKARKTIQPPLPKEFEPGLKAGVRKLKMLLREHAPELVLQYEALHPDRAKKVNG